MLASFLLSFREGLEAALIIGIILSTLRRLGYRESRSWVWAAVAVAAAFSLGLALILNAAGAELEGQAEYIFEGTAMLLAVGVLTWMIFWMRYQSRTVAAALEADVHSAVRRGTRRALFGMVFLAVFREGVELALFLIAARLLSNNGAETLAGSVVGLAAAAGLGWGIYTGTARLKVRHFFSVTSLLMLVFAAGLFAHGLHEFEEAGWLPALADQVWNLKPVLDDNSTVGGLLRVLVGYNDDPTLLEVTGYLVYWVVVLGMANWWASRAARTTFSQASAG